MERDLQELLLIGQVVIVLACQPALPMENPETTEKCNDNADSRPKINS